MIDKNKLLDKFAILDDLGRTLMTPFVVSRTHKTLYLHIAKTGGSSITKILRDNKLDDGILTNKKLSYEKKKEYFVELLDDWDDYYKFTFVRNKYSLLVSHWHYDKKLVRCDFPSFIKHHVVPSVDIYDYWIDQYYLTQLDGINIFDFIGHTEKFSSDLPVALDTIGIKKYNLKKRVNAGKYNHSIHFSEYYDEELKELVYKKFKVEIDFFGFELGTAKVEVG